MDGQLYERNSNGVAGVSWLRKKSKEAPVAAAALGPLEMHGPWARGSSHDLPSNVAAAFLSIANNGPADDRLVAASSPLADAIAFYGIKVVGADVEMRPLPGGLVIHAGGTTTLKPRGYHLLLRGVKAALGKGSTLPITLVFEKAGSVALDFAVEEPGLIGEAVLYDDHQPG